MFLTQDNLVQNRWFLLAIVLIAFFLNLGGVPLFDLDEGAFAEATREMLISGNFSATYLDGQPRYDKPIFSYWMQALSISLFGLNEWAIRLPSAIAGSLWLFVGYQFVKEQFNLQSAYYFVAMMALVFWVMIIARAGTADAWLNLFITLTVLNIWRYSNNPQRNTLLLVYFWMALGILTKGPVAILVPLLTAGISLSLQHKLKLFLRAIFNPLGWCVLLIVVSPWLFLVYQEQGIGFFHGFIFEHNLNRFSQTKEQHGGQFYYYLLLLPVILLPFSSALIGVVTQFKTFWRKPLEQFLLIWFLVVLTLVSLSKTQLPHYLLYGLTGLVMIIAHYRETLLKSAKGLSFPLIFLAFCGALPFIFSYAFDQIRISDTHRQDSPSYDTALLSEFNIHFDNQYLIATTLCILAALAITFLSKANNQNKYIYLGVIQAVFVFTVFIEAVAGMQQSPVYNAAQYAINNPKTTTSYQIRMPSFSVYREQITPNRLPSIGERVFTKIDKIDTLADALNAAQIQAHLDIVFQQGGIILIDVNPLINGIKTAPDFKKKYHTRVPQLSSDTSVVNSGGVKQ